MPWGVKFIRELHIIPPGAQPDSPIEYQRKITWCWGVGELSSHFEIYQISLFFTRPALRRNFSTPA
jgi:hypothetical protein